MTLSFYQPGGGCTPQNWHADAVIKLVKPGVDQRDLKRKPIPTSQLEFSTLRQHTSMPLPQTDLIQGEYRYPVSLMAVPFPIPREHSVQLNNAETTIILESCWYASMRSLVSFGGVPFGLWFVQPIPSS